MLILPLMLTEINALSYGMVMIARERYSSFLIIIEIDVGKRNVKHCDQSNCANDV